MDPVLAKLDEHLIRLHGTNQSLHLSELYEQAAELIENPDAQRFHLTHAWVHALEDGDTDRVNRLEARLRVLGGL